jgi:hypothetical protein
MKQNMFVRFYFVCSAAWDILVLLLFCSVKLVYADSVEDCYVCSLPPLCMFAHSEFSILYIHITVNSWLSMCDYLVCRLSLHESVHDSFYINAEKCARLLTSIFLHPLQRGEGVGVWRIHRRYDFFSALWLVSVMGQRDLFQWSWQWRKGMLKVHLVFFKY